MLAIRRGIRLTNIKNKTQTLSERVGEVICFPQFHPALSNSVFLWVKFMHYYQFNIGDYAKRTRHLTNLEDLAYRRLIDLYYTNESPMPDDLNQIARLISMRESIDEINNILSDFFTLVDGFWINKRADEEISKYHSKAKDLKKFDDQR